MMHIVTLSVILLVLFTSEISTLSVKTYSNMSSGIHNVTTDMTTLKVALFPYLPDSAGDNYIKEEFHKIQPTATSTRLRQ